MAAVAVRGCFTFKLVSLKYKTYTCILTNQNYIPVYSLIYVENRTCAIMLYVIDTVRVFLPKCPLITVRNRFSADELQIVRVEAEDTCVVRPH